MTKKEFVDELRDHLSHARVCIKQKDAAEASKAVDKAQDLLNRNFCRVAKFDLFDNMKFQGQIDRLKVKLSK
jgi:hypothetical protein